MFDAEGVVRGDTRLKVAPPLRDAANRRRLWRALLDGHVSLLSSDHTPATLEERAGSFFDATTGISGLQFTLSATWTEGREHGASLANLSR
jgi:allantoinase